MKTKVRLIETHGSRLYAVALAMAVALSFSLTACDITPPPNPPSPPIITTSSLPNGNVGIYYGTTLKATSDTTCTWSISEGSLPDGLTLNSSMGLISGTPTSTGTTYFTVKANNEAESRTKAVSINITEMPYPTGVTAVAKSISSITVSWNKVTFINNYKVYRCDSIDGTYTYIKTITINANTTTTRISYTDEDLLESTTYYYKVTAYNYNLNLESDKSAYASAFTSISYPTNVNAVANSSTSITVSWDAVSKADKYRVYRSTSSTRDYTCIETTTSTSYTDTNLTGGMFYYYKITAYNSDLNLESYYSSSTYAKTYNPSSVPGDANLLSYNSWSYGTMPKNGTHYYFFYATKETTYNIQWNDVDSSGGHYMTCDIKVSAYYDSLSGTSIFKDKDKDIQIFTPSSSRYVVLVVQPRYDTSYGTYEIKYY